MILFGLNGRKYELNQKSFSRGGEGDVFQIAGVDDKVVKIYHQGHTSRELEEKIKLMVQKPPSSNILNQVAWPLDVVYDTSKQFRGFVMPKLDITNELNEVYVYPPKTGITYQQKLVLAQNICVVIHEVHRAGYVFGDFNPRNIGINLNTGAVAFLDTDSYHIVISKDKNQAYRCNVCAPGYAAPELLDKCSYHISSHPEDKQAAYAKTPLDTFTKETDNFALAIHMFRLLMNGFTPFNGIDENENVSVGSPGVGDIAVRRDSYCFKQGNKPQAVAVPSLGILPDTIAKLFTRAFIDGKKHPKQRPDAIEWHRALEDYERSLVLCSKNVTHMYKRGLSDCPWCEADDRYVLSISPQLKQKAFSMPVVPVVTPPVNQTQILQTQGNASAQLNTFGASVQSHTRPAPVQTAKSTIKSNPADTISMINVIGAWIFVLYPVLVAKITVYLYLHFKVFQIISLIAAPATIFILSFTFFKRILGHSRGMATGCLAFLWGFMVYEEGGLPLKMALNQLVMLGRNPESLNTVINNGGFLWWMLILSLSAWYIVVALICTVRYIKQQSSQRAAVGIQRKLISFQSKRMLFILGGIAILVLIGLFINRVIVSESKYTHAQELLAEGQYEAAISVFRDLDGYKDSDVFIKQAYDAIHQSQYEKAESLFALGKYIEAAEIYSVLGDYNNSENRLDEINKLLYVSAEGYYQNGNFEKAIEIFQFLGAYEDAESRIAYINAEKMYSDGDLAAAAIAFYNIADDSEARQRSMDLCNQVIVSRRKPVTVNRDDNDGSYVFGITNDGHVKVVSSGSGGYGKCNVSDWSDIVQVSASAWHTAGLKSDGTVVAVGSNSDGECDVDTWSDIIQISATSELTAGLKRDGTVIVTSDYWQDEVAQWTNIVEISASSSHILGLHPDGTVVAATSSNSGYAEVTEWNNIISISAEYQISMGLKADGTVVTAGNNYGFDFDEETINNDWKNIIACETKANFVGLKADGTMIQDHDSSDDFYHPGLSSWHDIVYFSKGLHVIVGVQSDGNILVLGTNKRDFNGDISLLNDIRTVDKVY